MAKFLSRRIFLAIGYVYRYLYCTFQCSSFQYLVLVLDYITEFFFTSCKHSSPSLSLSLSLSHTYTHILSLSDLYLSSSSLSPQDSLCDISPSAISIWWLFVKAKCLLPSPKSSGTLKFNVHKNKLEVRNFILSSKIHISQPISCAKVSLCTVNLLRVWLSMCALCMCILVYMCLYSNIICNCSATQPFVGELSASGWV